jgi:hypothetical protein
MVEKPSVIANYMKNMGGVDTADQYCETCCFLRRTLKWWRKLFFWGLEVSIINAYILYVESCKNCNSNPMSHIKFRRELIMALVGISVKVVVHPQEEELPHPTTSRD